MRSACSMVLLSISCLVAVGPTTTATAAAPGQDVAAFVETLRQARAKGDAGQWPEAAALWEQVVRANPVNPYFWSPLANARYLAKDYRGAIAAYERAMELGAPAAGPATGAYRIACSYALLGDEALALQWLERAFAMGYPSLERARSDEALASLRDEPRFKKLLGLEDVSKLSRDEGWRYDLAVLAGEARRKGFLVRRTVTPEQLDAKVRELHDQIPRLTDWQVVLGLMRLMVFLDDGHTALWSFGDNPYFGTAVPLQFLWFEEGPAIVSADPKYADLVGAEVTAIDGHAPPEVVAAMTPYANRDRGNAHLPRLYTAYAMRHSTLLHALGIAAHPDALTLTVRDRSGATRTAVVAADATHPNIWNVKPNPPEWVRYASSLPDPPLYLRNMEKPYWFEYLPEKKTVYFAYNQVVPDASEPIETFVSRLFRFIDGHEVDKLVVDMRWNNGGDTFVGQPLLRALLANRKVNQPGKLFVIIGQRTYSAAQNMATYFERFTDAIFVGEPTGSAPNFIGEEDPVVLPYSKLMANVSHLYWQSSWPRDERMWLAPEVYVPPTWADFRAGRDAALEAVLAYPPVK